MNDDDKIFAVVVCVFLLIPSLLIANAVGYRNTTTVECNCQVTGLVTSDTDANISIGCTSGLTRIFEDVTRLEYQSLTVGMPIVVTRTKYTLLGLPYYEVVLNHPQCNR